MEPYEMSKSELAAAIASIVAAKPSHDVAGSLIVTKIEEFMKDEGISECEAIERLADLGPGYGLQRQLGGVNVYCDDDGEFTREVFTDSHNSTHLTHYLTLGELMLVNGYDHYSPLPFKPDWWLQEGTKDICGLPRIFGDTLESVIYH